MTITEQRAALAREFGERIQKISPKISRTAYNMLAKEQMHCANNQSISPETAIKRMNQALEDLAKI